MSQNIISLNLSAEDYAEVDAALATLENKLASLIDLSVDERRTLMKMGKGSGLDALRQGISARFSRSAASKAPKVTADA